MKVCILSMQKVDNFGSLLQSYALKKLIEYQGHDVGFIDIEIHEEDNQLLQGYKNEYESEKEITTKNVFLTKIKRVDKYFLNRIHIRKLHNRQKDILEQFRKEQLNIGKNNNAKYDVCVIGSDEVFNCMEDSEWGFTSQLFGNVKQAKRVITYAASCGMTTYDRVPDCAKEKIKESVKNIERFSVRDKNTRKFLERLSVENIYMHYDPVVIGDFSKEIMSAPETKNIPNKYCIIYSYYNRIHDPIEIKAITKFCKKIKSSR